MSSGGDVDLEISVVWTAGSSEDNHQGNGRVRRQREGHFRGGVVDPEPIRKVIDQTGNLVGLRRRISQGQRVGNRIAQARAESG